MFSDALRLIRTFHQISQSDLAGSLGISRSYLSELESGKKSPSLELLQRYSEHFGMPLSALIFFSENTDEPGKDLKIKKLLGEKAIAILQWIEQRAKFKDAA
ncbi:helix-turn-helix transcriptional regulator [Arenimonas sp.]|uniref:helix-turn-helix transcriptional regulator n=1 Tax=Arenimonas sp. TaxID=1872635 RepID=UPI002E316E0E|nr:helix-turn-helix transcriptional regulator [Arenimonas sp.]HEX4853056.1 helix-turn-helix transcriptional regulator [Arenimonas sp.]